HEVDSSDMAFKIAGSMAFQDAAKRAGPVVLEPIMAARGRRSRGAHGRRHRRPELASRAHRGYGIARHNGDHQEQRATFGDAWLRYLSAFADTGSRELFNAFRSIRTLTRSVLITKMTTVSRLWLCLAHLRHEAKVRVSHSPSQITSSSLTSCPHESRLAR